MIAIEHPFRFDPLGKVITTSDINKIYVDRLMTILSTQIYQRVMMPNYGTDLVRAMYESGQIYSDAVKEAITRAVSKFLPALSIVSVKVGEVDYTGTSVVEIMVSFPDGTIDTVAVNSKTLSSDGTALGDII
ncbi:GpW/Gp25/anti-adapter protein IraD [uncultured Caudovirales phage]|uniref:GpW/Gp25/anti-adapter protein IraD n=1 Tax=uncultured Caudovirales phage TaxID=2100421 RepID=A0A6J5N5U2_9CAUD|nr:GpW/Gp25/anti-adapter protein IraD [uncultured Caudovirales phage]